MVEIKAATEGEEILSPQESPATVSKSSHPVPSDLQQKAGEGDGNKKKEPKNLWRERRCSTQG